MWYKMLKSAIGAVFHIKQSLAEAFVGIPPISVANKVNSTKHLLKLNLFSQEDDPLKIFVTKHLSDCSHSSLSNKAKDAMQFLKWKKSNFLTASTKTTGVLLRLVNLINLPNSL